MRALTVQQPWASAIVAGAKRVENRSWPTSFRGRVLIHAGQKCDPAGGPALAAAGVDLPDVLPAGAILGSVEIVDCVRLGDRGLFDDGSDDPLATGPWLWMLRDPIAFDVPVACPGQLGLWRVAGDVAARVAAVVGGGERDEDV